MSPIKQSAHFAASADAPQSVASPNHTQSRVRNLALVALLVGALMLLAACVAPDGSTVPLPIAATPSTAQTFNGVIQSVAGYQLGPTPTPDPAAVEEEEEEQQTVVVATDGSRANVRSEPSLSGAIIAKANDGEVLAVIGVSEDGEWYQVTGGSDPAGNEGWVSASVVNVGGADDVVTGPAASSEALFDNTLEATWEIDWECESEENRCTIDTCTAEVLANVNRAGDGIFLPVEYNVTWADSCFDTDSWVFEVDPFTGRERSGEYSDNFLYSYWSAAGNEEISGVFPWASDTGIVVACRGPETVEVEEGGGWTTVYEGNICHDQRTGMLVYMNYTKRWLYTGAFEGENYERAFFGDVEHLEQRLVDTSIQLQEVAKR